MWEGGEQEGRQGLVLQSLTCQTEVLVHPPLALKSCGQVFSRAEAGSAVIGVASHEHDWVASHWFHPLLTKLPRLPEQMHRAQLGGNQK